MRVREAECILFIGAVRASSHLHAAFVSVERAQSEEKTSGITHCSL